MKKAAAVAVMFILLPVLVFAQNAKDGWQLELKRIALNLTSTRVTNAQKYSGFPDSRLSADDQSLIQGDFNFFAGLFLIDDDGRIASVGFKNKRQPVVSGFFF
ncbi:MAG: hypothetical protein LBI01_04430, partial [Elusimicrobium sp.]|nr:hypothetical protein [Elusimicrobium sp.]